MWGDGPLALVQASGELDLIEETLDEQTMTATCRVKRKGSDVETIRKFSKEDATVAGIWGRNVWKNYPKRMLQMRARGFALRDRFSDIMKGIKIKEEMQEVVTIDPTTKAPKKKIDLSLYDQTIEVPVVRFQEADVVVEEETKFTKLCHHELWSDIEAYFTEKPDKLKVLKKTVTELGDTDIKHFDWIWDQLKKWEE
jgi:hypothetical protein